MYWNINQLVSVDRRFSQPTLATVARPLTPDQYPRIAQSIGAFDEEGGFWNACLRCGIGSASQVSCLRGLRSAQPSVKSVTNRTRACVAQVVGLLQRNIRVGQTSAFHARRRGVLQIRSLAFGVAALDHMVVVRMHHEERTRHFVTRRIEGGASRQDIIRCLQCTVAREIFSRGIADCALAFVADTAWRRLDI